MALEVDSLYSAIRFFNPVMTVIVHATDSGDGVIYQQAIKYQAVSAVKP
jgi:hypothetical protein